MNRLPTGRELWRCTVMDAIQTYVYESARLNVQEIRRLLCAIERDIELHLSVMGEYLEASTDDYLLDLLGRRAEQRRRLRIAEAAVRQFESEVSR